MYMHCRLAVQLIRPPPLSPIERDIVQINKIFILYLSLERIPMGSNNVMRPTKAKMSDYLGYV